MGWVECISNAISYIEDNITEELTIEEIAKQVLISPFYFQKGFTMLCGFTVAEYIRQRRLALAGSELVSTDKRIIDIALDYGYDSPDSFTKAFTRFHGVTPTAVRKDGAMIKSFAPLKIKFILEGGCVMDYKIIEKDSFTVMGASKIFNYDNAKTEIPKFWAELYQPGKKAALCGMYGISIDETMGSDKFEYLVADNYNPAAEIPEGFVTKVIPAFTWAVFACRGAMPQALQEVNRQIFSEWLPNSKDYEVAAGYNIEMYSDPCDYKKGNLDEKYYSEIWIPVKKK
ncbi:AraC family transcriptional regulator [Acetanaerobacterium elongatum]|uniref:Transcriptional regulator, AraC family n=1 Tax=Acetanaerobacterium elongatum TaxID=258515 RepID=A0A1H0EV56_9FIRM|nr:AraC family transcriptional regulator [Acetanaerobacterium elongatum]SDN86252.1 transcriptional regulator, AraC family [Acetanaerobacterium elongatum]